jgi:hypothetical protein
MVDRMEPRTRPRTLLAAVAALALVLGGCGSAQTKTVSVSSLPARPASGSQATKTVTTSTTRTPTSTYTTTGGGEATRTATAPAFTKEAGGGEGLVAAQAVVRAHGYTANDTSDYHPNQTLRVLVGTRTGSSDGYTQQAFFFVDGRFIGTDTSEPSATVKVVTQSDTEVTLAYPLYKPGDPLSRPSGGESTVRFQLNNGRLVALDPIPPANSSTGAARN